MVFEILKRWISKWFGQAEVYNPEIKYTTDHVVFENDFSPMTYRNPFIMHIQAIIEQVIRMKHIPIQKLELIIIDAEEEQEDDDDIENVLFELVKQLNYLLLVTDRPKRYEEFMELVYEENGLIVQQMPKSARKEARGNLVLDFERSGGISVESMDTGIIYVPMYKRQWEIGENLDIIVPVGYNTLVVSGIFPSNLKEECLKDERFVEDRKLDRLDREFRKG